jgi:3'-phosphoadenosine 5'-phosphosulfate sulfotransferase (PAPS reductase)/FAD synthetase
MSKFDRIIASAPLNKNIFDSLLRARAILGSHRRIAVSISGGSDSDIMLDLIELVKPEGCSPIYRFFNTGLEYQATKDHIGEIESKYGVEIIVVKPKKPIPTAIHEYGVPFLSKQVSDMIYRLQSHNFDWNESPETATVEKYGRCKTALDWFYSRLTGPDGGKSRFDITQYKLLREFLQWRSPEIKISDMCCTFTKKRIAQKFDRVNQIDLVVTGMRRDEGGRRSRIIQTCFTPHDGDGPDDYYPLWYWSDEDKFIYKEWRRIRYSDCYEIWGFKRTGCVGCPFSSNSQMELEIARRYEPKVTDAAQNLFEESYEYQRSYGRFKDSYRKVQGVYMRG